MTANRAEHKLHAGRKLSHIDLEITRRCNLNCVHCSAAYKNRGSEMSVAAIEDMLKEAKSMGLEKVGLTGGEPFLDRERLIEVGKFCTEELQVPIHIHSNGTCITTQDALWIKQIDGEITIAFYGENSSSHEKITRTPGSFELTFNGLRNLMKAGANTCVYVVPMKSNLHSIKPLIKMVYNEGVKRVRVLSLSPTGRAKAQFEQLELSTKETERLNSQLIDIRNDLKIDLSAGFCTSQNFEGLNILKGHEQCFAAENRIHIDTFGNVFPCTASSGRAIFSAGNLQAQENSLLSIWSNSPLLQFFRSFHKNPPNKCQKCKRHETCMSGCRIKMSYKYGDVTIADPDCRGPYN